MLDFDPTVQRPFEPDPVDAGVGRPKGSPPMFVELDGPFGPNGPLPVETHAFPAVRPLSATRFTWVFS